MRITRLLGILFLIAALFLLLRGTNWLALRIAGTAGFGFLGLLLLTPPRTRRMRRIKVTS